MHVDLSYTISFIMSFAYAFIIFAVFDMIFKKVKFKETITISTAIMSLMFGLCSVAGYGFVKTMIYIFIAEFIGDYIQDNLIKT